MLIPSNKARKTKHGRLLIACIVGRAESCEDHEDQNFAEQGYFA